MAPTRLTIHVGYAKAATTWLQTRVFPALRGVSYRGVWPGAQQKHFGEDRNALLDLALSDAFDETAAARWFDRALSPDSPNVMSSEVILRPFEPERTARRLAAATAGHDVFIILSIRRQDELILSRYMHDLRVFGPRVAGPVRRALRSLGMAPYALSDALRWDLAPCRYPACLGAREACACLGHGAKTVSLPYYDYHSIYGLYGRVFGEGRVFVMATEEIADRDSEALVRLARHCGADMTALEQEALRATSRANPRRAGLLNQGIARRFDRSGERRRIMGHFAASNRALAGATGLPLGRYGYFE